MNENIWDSIFMPPEQWEILATTLAKRERWDYREYKSSASFPILRNYIEHTYKRLFNLSQTNPDGNYMIVEDNYLCFNTGLFTPNYEPIYAYAIRNRPEHRTEWKLDGFFQESARMLCHISKLPNRAIYFQDISEVFYDTKFDLRIKVDHILDDEENKKRIPEEYRDNKMLPMLLGRMAIDYAKMRIDENYKTAVPQFFGGKVQFLIPISLGDPAVVDLALAVSREGSAYTGKTCLTLDMAYNNARLIAKPESEWL
jgi:hypothetical protein